MAYGFAAADARKAVNAGAMRAVPYIDSRR